jgi:hypothetical protein
MGRLCFGSKGSASQLHSHERGNRQSGLHRGWSFLITLQDGDDRTVWQHEVVQTSARIGRPLARAELKERVSWWSVAVGRVAELCRWPAIVLMET